MAEINRCSGIIFWLIKILFKFVNLEIKVYSKLDIIIWTTKYIERKTGLWLYVHIYNTRSLIYSVNLILTGLQICIPQILIYLSNF